MKPKTSKLLYIAIAACAMACGIFFRLYPLIREGRQDAWNLATMVVVTDLRQKVQKFIEANYPTLSDAEKIRLAEENFQRLLKENRKNVEALVKEGTEKILASRPQEKSNFLLEADSYYFYGLTENIRDFGTISKQIKNGKFFDPLVLAPMGNWQPFCLHPYVGFYLYKIVSFFNNTVTLMSAIKYTVILLAALCVIPFLLICYTLGIRPLVAFVGTMFFIHSPFFTQRTAYGWYDTDVYNFLFPLLIFYFIFLGLRRLRPLKISLAYLGVASFFTGLYSLFWEGWGFVLVVMLVSAPAALLIGMFRFKDQRPRDILASFGCYLCASLIWVSIFGSPYLVIDTFLQSWKMLNNFLVSQFGLWPNIFLTVGETQALTVPKVSFLIFGNLHLIYVALAGPCIAFAWGFYRKDEKITYNTLILAVFMFSFTVLSLKAARNAVLLTVPLILGLTLTAEAACYLYDRVCSRIPKKAGKKFSRIRPALTVLLSLALASSVTLPLYAAHQICSRIYPIYNKAWDRALVELRTMTPPDSIVNTWWCPGHFVTSVAKRGATVDGATQHLPQTYWIATILMESDIKTAVGLLRMLNTSSNKALDFLIEDCHLLTSDAISLLKQIAPLTIEDARKLLNGKLTAAEAQHLLTLTHGTPRPSYFMIYNDLVDTYLALPYIGNWDFKKAEFLISVNKNGKQKIKIPSRESKGYLDFLWSLTGGVPPVSPQYPQVYRNKNIVLFENRFALELTSMECFLLSPDGTKFVNPKSLIYVQNDEFKEKVYPGSTLPFSVLLLEKDGVYTCILLDSSMAKSLLFRLYYLNGKGLPSFKFFLREEDPASNNIVIVYKVDWNAKIE